MPVASLARRLFTTPYLPDPTVDSFLSRLETKEDEHARVAVTVLDARESADRFGVPMSHHGVQPVFLRIENRSQVPLRLHVVTIDRNYYTPLEAAAQNHFSFAKRLVAFGAIGWFLLPLVALAPLKIITAMRANRRMDQCFQDAAFHLRAIPPGGTAEGFVFTSLDIGTKEVRVRLLAGTHRGSRTVHDGLPTAPTTDPPIEYVFAIPVRGIATDHARRDFATIYPEGASISCDLAALVERLSAMPATTTNRKATGSGDPVNLAVIGEFETVLSAFAARWDETETITPATCWKTVRAFLLGTQYRYSPVSPLYLFGRSQDVALQRIRHSINERLHLRLWLTPLRFEGKPVWIGQVSRDIGVRFTTKAWNLTTHRIDSDVDESRDYVLEDLLEAERTDAAGYVGGVGECARAAPRRNLTGDPYFTDGKRAVILLSESRTTPRFVSWA
ncbi:MAG: LssY C-terminal domain-containing protein [Phycisphaerales bacterium]